MPAGKGGHMTGALVYSDFRHAGRIVADDVSETFALKNPEVVIDSREIKEGDIFVALPGEKTDGHRYIDEVFAKGASWAVVSREWFEEQDPALIDHSRRFLVAVDTVKALQQLAASYRSRFRIPVVAVGGSNGKTTTKEMVAGVLKMKFRVHMSQGNRNNHLGVPLTLLQMKSDTGIAVVEMGINHPGELAFLAELAKPTHGLLTNIGHEHLEFFGSLEGVAAAETELFDYLNRNDGTVFVNTDDPWLNEAGKRLHHAVRYGSINNGSNTWWPEDASFDRVGRVSFQLCSFSSRERVSLNFIGRQNVVNALAAATVGEHFGLTSAEIRDGLEALQPATGWKRMELLEGGGIVILNDTYNANPDSMRLALDTLAGLPCHGKKIAVLGDMLELGSSSLLEHEKIGSYIQRTSVDLVFTFGSMSEVCCRFAGNKCGGHFENRDTLLESLAGTVRDGDALLFKGSRGMRLELVAEALLNSRITE
jgi:UDP-N-acetylmuramoyl-tripeptide--D-alanyl-D-alanine ligase